MIEFKTLNKSFGKNKVLRELSLSFKEQGTTAVIGPNGSGKTTLIKCFLGLVLPDSGSILFNNASVIGKSDYRNQVSYLPQIARFPENLSCRELISMIKNLREGQLRDQELIELFELDKELDKKVSTLSGGNKQKLNLLLSLMFDNQTIILDEPSNGLDPVALINLKAFLSKEKDRGKFILLTTHIMSFVEELADNIVFLLDGKVYYNGSLQELLRKQETENLEQAIARILNNHQNGTL